MEMQRNCEHTRTQFVIKFICMAVMDFCTKGRQSGDKAFSFVGIEIRFFLYRLMAKSTTLYGPPVLYLLIKSVY